MSREYSGYSRNYAAQAYKPVVYEPLPYSDIPNQQRPRQAVPIATPREGSTNWHGSSVTNSEVKAAQFHSGPAPSTGRYGDSKALGRQNSQTNANRGFAAGERKGGNVAVLADDWGLTTPDMIRGPGPKSAGYLEKRVLEEREKVLAKNGRNGVQAPHDSTYGAPAKSSPKRRPGSPTKADQVAEAARKEQQEEELVRDRFEARAKAMQAVALEKQQLLRKARRAAAEDQDSKDSVRKPAKPGNVFDKIKQASKIQRSKQQEGTSTLAARSPEKKRKVDKGKSKVVQVDVTDDEETSPRRKRKSDPDHKKPSSLPKKASRLGGARRNGFEEDDTTSAKPQPPRNKNKNKKASRLRDIDSDEASETEEPAKRVVPLHELLQEARVAKDATAGDTPTEVESTSDDDMLELDGQPPSPARRTGYDARFDSPEKLFEPTQAAVDPDSLCPFCDQPLPDRPSEDLLAKKATLLRDPSAKRRATIKNPKAVRLRDGHVMRTAEFCKQHENERKHIPLGRERGWPSSIDWKALPARIERLLCEHLTNIVLGKTPTDFLEQARADYERLGGKRSNAVDDFATFSVEEPGYYGPEGRRVMYHAIETLFTKTYPLLTSFRAAPLDVDFYIRRVLVPECGVELIRDDLGGAAQTSRDDAVRVMQESRGYGKAMFPDAGGDADGAMREASQAPPEPSPTNSEPRSQSRRVAIRISSSPSPSPSPSPSKKSRKSRDLVTITSSPHVSDSDDSTPRSGRTARSSPPSATKSVQVFGAGGFRKPKGFSSSSATSKSTSSGSTAFKSSKSSNTTAATTLFESDVSDDDCDALRPPPSAQASSSKPASSGLSGRPHDPLKSTNATGLLAGMHIPSGVSDSESEAESVDSLPEEISTGGVAKNPKKDRSRSKKTGSSSSKKRQSPRKAKKIKSPKKRK